MRVIVHRRCSMQAMAIFNAVIKSCNSKNYFSSKKPFRFGAFFRLIWRCVSWREHYGSHTYMVIYFTNGYFACKKNIIYDNYR